MDQKSDEKPDESSILEIAYCVKCKKKVLMLDSNRVSLKGGKTALQGICPDCGTKVFRILGGAGRRPHDEGAPGTPNQGPSSAEEAGKPL